MNDIQQASIGPGLIAAGRAELMPLSSSACAALTQSASTHPKVLQKLLAVGLIWLYVHIYIYTDVNYIFIFIYIYTYVYIYIYIYICMCIYIYIYMEPCVHVYMYVYIYIYIHTYMHKGERERGLNKYQYVKRIFKVCDTANILAIWDHAIGNCSSTNCALESWAGRCQ